MRKRTKMVRMQAFEATAKTDSKILRFGIITEYLKSLIGLVIGILVISKGIGFIKKGIEGEIDIEIKFKLFETTIGKASPGILICLIGLIIIFILRPKIKIKE